MVDKHPTCHRVRGPRVAMPVTSREASLDPDSAYQFRILTLSTYQSHTMLPMWLNEHPMKRGRRSEGWCGRWEKCVSRRRATAQGTIIGLAFAAFAMVPEEYPSRDRCKRNVWRRPAPSHGAP
ncbi:hypothetical protein BU26DRAFT_48220 [Trematosphaeria pertusa]|uniref:Uncharacterized protein n=1 Tax=Trematosphaeria pertusa TaxID=390896 RepID=A0A6A6I8D2_9PLEO|nr:uncharacterized protein BU26DRAFT_48220 [Trematosphaeria pertusa]KAF2246537.1 hypothetical protein BU26DRAFT_48220 [Trematosphaeria pertusa]